MKKVYSLFSALLFLVFLASAQSQMGEIRGKITDSKTKKPLDYASITIELNGVVKATTLSEDDGSYIVKTLQPGDYTVKVTYTGYRNAVVTDVDVISDQIAFVNITMESTDGKVLDEVVIKRKKPLVDPDQRGSTKTSKEIMALPQRNANMIAGTTAGVDSRAGSTPNFRGARADGTAYYVDGQRVYGSLGVPQNAIDQVQVITGGTPAQYGDFIGGAISINTKAPSRNWNRGIEFITSTPFNGYLDNSNFNELQAFISGPIKIVNQGKGDKERVLLGFSFASDVVYARDGRLPATKIYTLTEEKQREINNVPMVPQSSGGFINKGEYLSNADLREVDYRQNAASYRLNIQGNFAYQPANNITVKLGYQGEYSRGRNFSYYYSLMNPDKNTLSTAATGRVYLQFTQRFNEKSGEEAKKSLITNAFYSVRVSYENNFSQSMDPEFEHDLFKYGHIGKLTSYSMPVYGRVAKGFGQSPDTFTLDDGRKLALTNYYRQVGHTDTLLTFQQADYNVNRGNYTKQVFDYTQSQGGRIFSSSQLRALNGLINGENPASIYSGLWGSSGTQTTGSYGKSNSETIQLYVMSEASVGSRRNSKNKHDIQFGMNFEQRFIRSYSVAGTGLWTLMRLYTNNQFQGMDESNPMAGFDQNGVFNDTIKFNRLVLDSAQTNFDKNLRNKLISSGAKDQYGNYYNQQSFIDVNSLDPSTFSLDMFSADELLNNGNSYVSYSGYDYLGNRVKGKPGVNKFLNDPLNRTIGAYQPIYTAAWLQDKFVFKDLIVRIGVRIERFDANQVVLKDPYSMAPIYTAGDIRRAAQQPGNKLGDLASSIPGSVGDDYAVYVDDATASPEKGNFNLSGFRNGNDWFDKEGNPVTDPNTLWKNSVAQGAKINRNTPYLVNPGQTKPDAGSFTDYKADVLVLPRISFSFPVSSTSQFFGTYDVLAQRPSNNVGQIDDYYYLTLRQGAVLQNPDLKMTRVTDYQIGFRQQIGSDAALGIKGSYREFRNLIQLYNFNQAWPVNYTSFSNIDFSTVKSIDIEYELRDLGNVTLSANYMLQFADGTGSNAGSSSALIAANLPQQRNVFPLDYDTRNTLKGIFDFHYKDGKEYDGPVVGGRKIFTNAGVNVIFNYVTGRPYTEQLLPTPEVMSSTNRPQVKGTPNGSRQPSQFYADINIDKNFMFRSESLDGKTTVYRLRMFLWIQNVFNNINALGVYRYTGSAYSDGFINSVQADATLKAATNAQSLVDLYNIRVVDPGAFALPRLTRLGLALYF